MHEDKTLLVVHDMSFEKKNKAKFNNLKVVKHLGLMVNVKFKEKLN
jgi:hypothetical protein